MAGFISTPQEFAAAGYAIDDFLLYGALSIPEFLRLLPDKDTAGGNAPQPEISQRHCFEGADESFMFWLSHMLHQQTS